MLRELLTELAALGAKVAGSYALGTENQNSDIDFFIPENKFDLFRPIAKKWRFKSSAPGQFYLYLENELIEVSYRFPRTKSELKLVEIHGTWFKTH